MMELELSLPEQWELSLLEQLERSLRGQQLY